MSKLVKLLNKSNQENIADVKGLRQELDSLFFQKQEIERQLAEANASIEGTTGYKYRAELYDEVWAKAKSMGFANVTDALTAFAEANKKLAEQQAYIHRLCGTIDRCHVALVDGDSRSISAAAATIPHPYPVHSTEELSALLSKAKEEGRAEAQHRIKVLEDALQMYRKAGVGCSTDFIIQLEAHSLSTQALSTASHSEALDKVVREAVEKERERCAKVCKDIAGRWSDINVDVLPEDVADECAEAIRRIEP